MAQLVAKAPRRNQVEEVLDWRFDVLESAGYNPIAALALANSTRVDLQFAVGLLADGCPQDTALRILL